MAVIERHISTKSTGRWINREAHESLLQSIGRYTRFVLLSKVFLGAMSALMIISIIIIPVLNADEEGLRLAFSTVKDKADSLPLMTNPTFQGVDDNNQPYMITADSALQHDTETIILSNIHADLFTEDKNWLSITAKKGTLKTESKTLQLNGDVQLYHDQGYEFSTDVVNVDMNNHRATSNTEVNGRGPLGIIKSNGFVWENDKRVMQFTNGVNLRVHPKG